MNCSVTFIAHGAAKEILIRHIPFWLKLEPVLVMVISPVDDAIVSLPPLECHAIGGRGHACKGSIERLRWILRTLAGRNDIEQHFVTEYDAIPLSTRIIVQPGWAGPMQLNHQPQRYIAPTYSTSPWMAHHKTVCEMSATAQRHQELFEHGLADRYFAGLAKLGGVPLVDYDPPCLYSQYDHSRGLA